MRKLIELFQLTMVHINASSPENFKALASQAENHRLAGRYPEALLDFNRAIALNPNYAWAIAHRGETYYLMARYQEALADFSRAVALKANYAWGIARQGVAYRHLGCYPEALASLSQAIALQPDYAWALAQRCQLHVFMNRYEEALADCDRALALNPAIVSSAAGERGLLLSYLQRYADAVSCCQQGLKERPDDWITLYTLAAVKARWQGLAQAQEEIAQAQTALQAACDRSVNAGALYRLGGLAALAGNKTQALEYLQAAIALDREPLELARRDIAWDDLRQDWHFQSLTKE